MAAYYPVDEQLGLDVQGHCGDWLLKLETIQRHGMGNAYTTSDVGFGIYPSRCIWLDA
ncbi:MAG: hypothetical protein IPM78_13110 [Moraxellaceae bacterium]|nr:hypothetical protein [Moraxellaceae bacterium]